MSNGSEAGSGVYVSALDLFSIGVGPSSSHTVGPMRAGLDFRNRLRDAGQFDSVTRFRCRLEGSLAATGVGHGTPDAVIAGLRGYEPESVDPGVVHGNWTRLYAGEVLDIDHVPLSRDDIEFAPLSRHGGHPNAMMLIAEHAGSILATETYLSIGGGFIRRLGEEPGAGTTGTQLKHRYRNMAELLALTHFETDPTTVIPAQTFPADAGTERTTFPSCRRTIAEIAWEDEVALHGADPAVQGLDAIWQTMRECIERGLSSEGTLPGGLKVRRRAAAGWRSLLSQGVSRNSVDALSMYALAVNEENAAGGRVVTAPTNGAAGVLPAVLYGACVEEDFPTDTIRTFLLTATAVGSIFKANASISGAEAGCQAEVGSACAMAAAGLTAIRGGTPEQIENAAEIAIEHHLGLTCDPVGGLVQIPCIERNAIAGATAVAASRLALLGDGRHVVPLDVTIETMRQTGADMSERYKETSRAGLAVNVVEC
ncbi:L-serine ammonia-lyase [Propionimicrobium sp. PCR01-08-3]|uniref:L-serine ammonia-lyase n=1 Tax=Propionimicrobium sp. PCR01-08-3 TaxID=3052086 RepID=UPI00255C7B6E|nr:L-serine ammonia-lyase [Propionimicrobium sp. PCR01-08-3]WIY81522.1 L-serine ammonia-lyase [Propionimicrobium sp. PCR01-08-3]